MSFVNVQDRKLPFIFRYLADLLAYRHLCWSLVQGDLKSRFRRTKLGYLWALLQPLAFALMIAFVWGNIHKSLSFWEFALYVLAGSVMFEAFSAFVQGGQDSLSSAGGYLRQARIPLFIFQLRTVLTATLFFLIESVAVVMFGVATGEFPAPGLHLLLLPAYLGVLIVFGSAVVIVVSVAGTQFRDLRHILGLVMRALFLVSPVMMPREIFNEPQLKFMEFANPLVPLLDMYRDPMIYGRMWDPQDVIVIAIWTAALWMLAMIAAASAGRKLVFAL